MTVQPGANLYTQGFGSYPENVEIPVISNVDPGSNNTGYPIGKRWINQTLNNSWVLTSIKAFNGTLTANWEPSGGAATTVSEITGNSGVAMPVGGNINIVGTTGEFTTTGAGNTLTIAVTDPFTVNDLIVTTNATIRNNATIGPLTGSVTTIGNDNAGTIVSIEGPNVAINTTSGSNNLTTIGEDSGTSRVVINSADDMEINSPNNVVMTVQALQVDGGFVYKYARINTTSYQIVKSDYFIGMDTTGGPLTVLLDAAPVVGQAVIIEDVGGSADANQIVVDGNGLNINVPNGISQGTLTINTVYTGFLFVFNGVAWSVVA